MPTWNSLPPEVLAVMAMLVVAVMIGRVMGASGRRALVRQRDEQASRVERSAREFRQLAAEAGHRAERAERAAKRLERTLAAIPEMAQRLTAARNPREIPGLALTLVQEILEPSYAAFYKCSRSELVLVARRGRCELIEGHRLDLGRGIVGLAATQQLTLTPEEIRAERGTARRDRSLDEGMPEEGFELCVPVISGSRTLGVMLIGPCQRNVQYAREQGRSIALMTSVSITSSVVLREQELLARMDGLTGLLNKAQILERIQAAIASDDGRRRPVSIFLFDIDHFRNFNEANGHLPGDELLKSLSSLLKSHMREGELLGRHAGEEFLMVLPGVDRTEALKAALRVRSTIASHAFEHGEKQPLGHVSISGGISTWPADGSDVESLLRCADEARQHAKRSGRDRVFAYMPTSLATHEPHFEAALEKPEP